MTVLAIKSITSEGMGKSDYSVEFERISTASFKTNQYAEAITETDLAIGASASGVVTIPAPATDYKFVIRAVRITANANVLMRWRMQISGATAYVFEDDFGYQNIIREIPDGIEVTNAVTITIYNESLTAITVQVAIMGVLEKAELLIQ